MQINLRDCGARLTPLPRNLILIRYLAFAIGSKSLGMRLFRNLFPNRFSSLLITPIRRLLTR